MKAAALIGVTLAVLIAGTFGAQRVIVWWHLHQSRTALGLRDAGQAVAHLDRVLQLDSNHADAHLLLARAHRRLGNFDLVHDHIARARDLGAPLESLEREQWLALAQTGQFSKADRHLQSLLTDPGDDGAEICEAYISGYFLTYRYGRALPLLEAWKADYPDDPQPYYFLGLFAEHGTRWSAAAAEYRRALERDPHRTDVRLRLAKVLVNLHEVSQAKSEFRLCLDDRPQDADALAGWAHCLLSEGKPREAQQILESLLRTAPDHFDGLVEFGRLKLNAGFPEEAARLLKVAVGRKPFDVEAQYALATALQAAGDRESAQPHFAFVEDARQAQARMQALWQKLLAQPEDVQSRYELGATLLEYGDPSAGLAWLNSVLDIRPDHVDTHRTLAAYYSKGGNHTLAERHQRRAEAVFFSSTPVESSQAP